MAFLLYLYLLITHMIMKHTSTPSRCYVRPEIDILELTPEGSLLYISGQDNEAVRMSGNSYDDDDFS